MDQAKKGTEVIRADDFVEYFLFPSLDELAGNNVEEKLDNFLREINECAQQFTVDYIWHKEPFQLVVRTPNTSKLFHTSSMQDDLPPHLYGLTFYGENIQDEWYIVEILCHLTKIYPNAISRVCDSDGEFLLIEAAEVLPKWANPDTCGQRVYIKRGHIVLVQNTESDRNTELSIATILKRINDQMNLYDSNEITKCIEQRFIETKMDTLMHRACVYLPISAAILLKRSPQIISYAVRAFCHRDAIDMKLFRAMKHFPPETRVYTQVTFTKCLYALLSYHNYRPSQRTGWNLPDEKHETYKAHMLGMKIACGLEICASKVQSEQTECGEGGGGGGSVEQSKSWQQFCSKLKQSGYFNDLIDGSREFMQRLDKAKQYFRIFSENHSTYVDVIAQEIHNHLKDAGSLNAQYSMDEVMSSEYDASLNDNEDWMNITQDEFDNMMNERYGMKKTVRCCTADEYGDPAADLSTNLNKFLDQKSEFDGVEFRPSYNEEEEEEQQQQQQGRRRQKDISSAKLTAEPSPSGKSSLNTGNTINFDPDAFQHHLKDMLDFVIPEDNWDSHSDSMSDFDEENIERNIDLMTDSGAVSSFSAYMEQMDRELAATTIGKSFKTKGNNAGNHHKAADHDNDDDDGGGVDDDDDDDDDGRDFDDIESFKPVNIDVNALKNLAESYKAQYGGHGPTSSLLSSLGMRLKADDQQNTSTNEMKK